MSTIKNQFRFIVKVSYEHEKKALSKTINVPNQRAIVLQLKLPQKTCKLLGLPLIIETLKYNKFNISINED
jgi:hypothetical protein